MTPSARAREQVELWAKELHDLSRRNKSLYYKDLKRGTLRLVAPDQEEIHTWLGTTSPRSVYLPPPSDVLDRPWTVDDALSDADEKQLVSDRTERSDVEKVLRNLDTQTQADFLDRGLESLYVCFGMLNWQEAPGAETVASPLIFVPVKLERESPRDPYRLRRGDLDAVLNPSLRVLMYEWFGITLPEHSAESADEEDLSRLFQRVREAVREHGWTVEQTAVLKRATFHKEAMYRDLLDNIEQVTTHPIVTAIADPSAEQSLSDDTDIPGEDDVDEVAPPEESHLIRDADASQRRAIAAALRGTSFVMDGPPGTGKSQTISNLIAELIAGGKTVLFVSEKIAALDVVADRLRDRGLGDFLLELHSHKVSRREVAQELGKALQMRPTASPNVSGAELKQYKRTRTSLTGYAEAVNRVREPLGLSLHWVFGRLAQFDPLLAVPPPASVTAELSADDVAELTSRFEELARVWDPAEQGDLFVWRGLRVADLTQARRGVLVRTLEQLDEASTSLDEIADGKAFAAGMPTPDGVEGAQRLASVCGFAGTQPDTEPRWWTSFDLDAVAARLDEIALLSPVHASEIGALYAAYEARWEEFDPASARQGIAAHEALGKLVVPAVPRDEMTVDAVGRRIEFLRQTRELAERIPAQSNYVAEALGARARERTVQEACKLAEVARGADASVRPEQQWAIPSVGTQVRQAINVLSPLVRDYQERHESLAEVFEDEVYDLDLRGLVLRFNDVHRGLRKLGGAYRADKRLVAQASRTRRADKRVRGRLDEALKLQQLRDELDERDTENGVLLGRYYRPRASHVDAAAGALDQLQNAVKVLGPEYDAKRVAAQLTGDAPADADLGARAQRLLDEVEKWRDAASSEGFDDEALAALIPDALCEWADSAADATSTLYELFATAIRLRASEGDFRTVLGEALRRVAVDERIQAMRKSEVADQELLGRFAAGFSTDVDAARKGLDWVSELQQLNGAPLRERAVQQLHGNAEPPDPGPLEDAIHEARKLVDEIVSAFDDSRADELRDGLAGSADEVHDMVGELLDNTNQIETWQRFVELTEDLRHAGWAGPVDACVEARITAGNVVGTLEKAMYTAWLDGVAVVDKEVATVRGADLDAAVESFRSADRRLIDNAAEWVVERCTSRRPKTTVGAAGIIEREAKKQKRHKPVRMLLDETAEVVTALKPCFMMSPLSVSQFIPPDMRFGVIIFDEASQITPPDAVNCIYRGDQLVVAGDEKQLPPTSFFERASNDTDDVYDEEQFDDFESMLDQCKGAAGMPSLPLRWHYRSHHESLITFSNYQFYDGSLITYPGARTDGEDLGVESFVVNGVYRRGSSRDNRVEAEKVADRALYHADNHPNLKVGVVTFSEAQAEMVNRVIEDRRSERRDLDDWFKSDRLDGFFVKNLESVQGDERDVIIFSVGYGPDEHGKTTLAFGPLSRAGGERRLNVAITRARRRVEVVSSFRPGEIDPSRTKYRGVKELLRYLEYADRGMSALAVDQSQSEGEIESPLEQSVHDTVRSWGYEVVPQVGSAGFRVDLGVRHPSRPGEFMLGIECDGRAYHSSRVARDRDRLRQEVLEGLGWDLHRIWGPSWYRERSEQEKRLKVALERAVSGGGSIAETGHREPAPVERTYEESTLDAPPDWAVPYKVAPVRAKTQHYPYDPEAFSDTVRVVREVLNVEAPMHADLLGRRVADAFGCNLTKRVRKAVQDAVLTLSRKGYCKREDVWISVNGSVAVRVPTDDPESRRKIEQIPHSEVDDAVYRLLQDAKVASDEELLTQIGRLFGIQRISNRAREVLEESLIRLHDGGRVHGDRDGRVRPAQ